MKQWPRNIIQLIPQSLWTSPLLKVETKMEWRQGD